MFSEEIKYQIDFFKNNIPIIWSPTIPLDILENKISTKNKTFFYSKHELYSDYKILNEIIEKSNKEIYISLPTTTPIKNGFNPLVNLLHFRNVHEKYTNPMKEQVIWQLGEYSEDSLTMGYFNFSNIENYKNLVKSNKSILSVRKYNVTRDEIFKKINLDNFDGIARYIRVESDLGRHKKENLLPYHYVMNDNPTTSELIKEYCKSFISFVVETDSSGSKINPITEKTLIPFLTQSLPIVYGGANYIKELENIGFYTANNDLGFSTDSLDYGDIKKVNDFANIVDKINKLSYSEVKTLYRKQYTKIKRNYDIMYELYFSKKTWKIH